MKFLELLGALLVVAVLAIGAATAVYHLSWKGRTLDEATKDTGPNTGSDAKPVTKRKRPKKPTTKTEEK